MSATQVPKGELVDGPEASSGGHFLIPLPRAPGEAVAFGVKGVPKYPARRTAGLVNINRGLVGFLIGKQTRTPSLATRATRLPGPARLVGTGGRKGAAGGKEGGDRGRVPGEAETTWLPRALGGPKRRGSAGPGPRGPRATESGKRMDCPALPPGWKKEEVIRKSGLSAGKSDVYYFSPSGKKFRSKPQLARYLGNTVDLSSFDFRTGKMMPSKLQKNKQRLRNDPLNQNKGKPDLNTTLPIRQTASIFKQPVTKVTNHPSNKVKSDPQRMNEQPRQLFWEKRLQGLSASDVTEQIIKTMELPKGLQGVGPGSNDETLLSAVASALHTSSAPITGQVSAAVEKNPAVWLNTSQPLCKAFIVTDEDIRKQEERVQQVRKKLEEALMADILSRAADTEEMDVEMDSGDEA
uniref:methyl-CpG-binding domain protein 2 n=1 Tax=Ictidomys tridecemlineatus TaxID=43179 RepID=UPI001A9FE372|nr:methyl-CpG-binding domain protein 2 [Ictidomys tridecemlineatus]